MSNIKENKTMSNSTKASKGGNGGMDRRNFNKLFASSGLAMVSMSVLTGGAAAASDIRVVDWSNYHIPKLLKDYVDKYGKIPPNSIMTSNDNALQKILSGAVPIDASHPDTVDLPRWRDAGVVNPIDEARLSNWPDVFDEIKKVPNVYADGKLWIVPASFGNSSVIYRTDLVDPEYIKNPTWNILWDERYKGRIAMRDDISSLVIAGLLSGAKNIWNMAEDELATATELMRKQRNISRFYWNDLTTMEQAMASGEIVAAVGWNTSVSSLKASGVSVEMMRPKEGIFTWLDGIVWTNTGRGPEERVYDLMNSWIGTDAGRYLINELGYGHTNRKTYDMVPPERLDAVGLKDPIGVLSKGIFGSTESKARKRMETVWEDIKGGF